MIYSERFLPSAMQGLIHTIICPKLIQNIRLFISVKITAQTVHIYGIRADRAKIDNISAYLESVLKHLKDGYEYHFNHRTTEKQVIADNTDVQPLLHIVLDFTYNYTKKEK